MLSTAGLSALVYGLIEAPRVGWTSFETLGLIAAGLALMGVFAMWELRNKQPMLDVRLFARPAFGVSSLTLTLVFFTLMGIFFSVAQLFQLVMGYGAFESALRMAPIFLFMMVAAPISPQLAARFGKRRVVALGLLTLAVGIGTLSFLPADAVLPARAGRHGHHGDGHGPGDVADHRPADVRGAAHEGGHGFGDQRHDARAWRRARCRSAR